MILDKEVEITLNGSNIKYYYNLGYCGKWREKIMVKVEDLSIVSHQEINVKCDICGNEKHIKYGVYNKNIQNQGYYSCSRKCCQIKINQTCIDKYGYVNPSKNEEIKNKWKKTKREKYGDENYNNMDKNKKTKLEKYGDENYNNREQSKITCLEKYGYEHSLQSEEIKTKSRKTCLKKYGVEFSLQSEEVKNKSKETNLNKYSCEYSSQNENIKNKSKKTKLEKYGDGNYINKDEFKKTCLKIYGVENPFQSEEIKEKIKITSLEKYGFEHASQNENVKNKVKKTKLERYGDENYSNKEKYKQTCLEKYGVENPSQDENIYIKTQKNGFLLKYYKNLYYRGTYELDFLEEFYDKLKIENGKSIKYKYEDKDKIYFSDFYLPQYNLIVEIKSSYYQIKYLEKNSEKQKACLEQGYDFIFIIDKNYEEFLKLIETKNGE